MQKNNYFTLTIIIPVYNSEKFIEECINSIVETKKVKIILVNDGSTDNGIEIARKIVKTNVEFEYLEQDNKGYGSACNRALCKIQSEYFTILEPDDHVESGYYDTLIEIAKSTSADIVAYNGYIQSGKILNRFQHKFCGKLVNFKDSGFFWYKAPCLWNAIYKTSKIGKCRFVESRGASYQDVMFQVDMFETSPNIYIVDEVKYHYRKHENQSINFANDKILDICIGWILELRKIKKENRIYFFGRTCKQIAGTNCSLLNKIYLYLYLTIIAKIIKHKLSWSSGIKKPFLNKNQDNLFKWIFKKIKLWRRK